MPNEPYYEILTNERNAHLLTQEQLAADIDADARLIRSWESGRRFPSNKYCKRLCERYQKSAEELGIAKNPFHKGRSNEEQLHKRLLAPNSSDYRSILGSPPPIHAKTIQQRAKTVKELYEKLMQPDVTAIAITGIAGVGKSTLAALIARYAKEQFLAGKHPFQTEPLWLRIDPATTMTDLIGTIYAFLRKPLPDLSHLAPQNQALALFHTLNTVDKPLLIILDEFENLLDWGTGHTLYDRAGIGEWIDVINSQLCLSRILLTSCPWPQGTHTYPPVHMQEFLDKGLKIEEGIELLQKQGVQARRDELHTAVVNCEGNAFVLTLLASFLRGHDLSLELLFNDPFYSQFWMGNVASNFLNSIYQQQLNQTQRLLLFAFSIYREPVQLSAVQALTNLVKVQQHQIALDIETLLIRHLLQPYGNGYFDLHTIVASYIRERVIEDDRPNHSETKRLAHMEAAEYYLQQSQKNCPTREQRKRIQDVYELVEVAWHYCQAEQYQKAYTFLQQEGLYFDLKRWGGSTILLKLYCQLLPLDRWQFDDAQSARIYYELSELYNNLWQNEQALEYCKRAYALFKKLKDQHGEAEALGHLGGISSDMGQNEQALEYCQRSISLYSHVGDFNGEGTVLSNLGWLHCCMGEKQRALACYTKALSLHQKTHNREQEGIALNGLGLAYTMLGQCDQALVYYLQALATRREVGDRKGEGITLNGLGLVYKTLGQNEQALNHYQQALSINRELGVRGNEGRNLNNIAEVYAALEQNESALEHYQQALAISRKVGDRAGESWILTNIGNVYSVLEEREKALKCYQQALAMSKEVGDREGEGTILSHIGTIYLTGKRYELALVYLWQARSMLEEVLSLKCDKVQQEIDALAQEVGEEQFSNILKRVVSSITQIIKKCV